MYKTRCCRPVLVLILLTKAKTKAKVFKTETKLKLHYNSFYDNFDVIISASAELRSQ